jgi:uncharacterized protein
MNDYLATRTGLAAGSDEVQARAQFISRTYAHLTGAVFLFTLIEVVLFKSGLANRIALALTGVSWLIVLGAFVLIGWLATRTAATALSLSAQYAALAGYVVAEALIFVPLLFVADQAAPGAISSAAVITMLGFAALTIIAFMTRMDFSFLRGILVWSGLLALVAIAGAVLFKFNLGTWFSVAMIGLAGASILYDTSNILRHYPADRYVSASLQLFASVALMFWYVLRLFLGSRR